MTIAALPAPPLPTDTPAEFNTKGFNLLGALPAFVTEANALGVDVSGKQSTASAAATAAAESASAASDSEAASEVYASNAGAHADGATASAAAAADSADAAAMSAASITAQVEVAVHGAASKATPEDDDELGFVDSAAGFILKKFKWLNLTTALSAVFAIKGSLGGSGITGAAESGPNGSITSLSGLTTPLSAAQGGTGNVNGGRPGDIFTTARTTAPAGSLVCPISATNVSRTTYAALFAAIGTTWGAGDGFTTFGIPWFPADYVLVQANANVGSTTTGAVIAHTHTLFANDGANGTGNGAKNLVGNVENTGLQGASTGGSANLAAGRRVLICVQY